MMSSFKVLSDWSVRAAITNDVMLPAKHARAVFSRCRHNVGGFTGQIAYGNVLPAPAKYPLPIMKSVPRLDI